MRVLFVCTWNAIRSPMAAALLQEKHPDWQIESAGIYAEPVDGFAVAVMAEKGIDISGHEGRTLQDIPVGLPFDQVIVLSTLALQEMQKHTAPALEFWKIHAPTDAEGGREQKLDAYRALRQELETKLATHFAG